jgi:hypothetical protein
MFGVTNTYTTHVLIARMKRCDLDKQMVYITEAGEQCCEHERWQRAGREAGQLDGERWIGASRT